MSTSPRPDSLPPTGPLTFLFTDIEDSTRLWQAAPEAMQTALARHDMIVRQGIASHGGHVFKTAGDAFYAAFVQPQHALEAARLLQHALFTEAWPELAPLRVRMALHAGVAGFRDGDYFGPPLNVVARLLSASCGGQTLLSASVGSAVGNALAAGAELERHGYYRLKGVDDPVEVWELGVRGRSTFAPPADTASVYRVVRAGELWQPVRAIRHNLPVERDTFVGRTLELHALAQRLEAGARLTTVLGPAGTGKTRLVRRYGRAWLGEWPGGVYFCDLSDARSLDGVLFAVAMALDVPLGKGDPAAQLGHAIAGRGRCLVILDNFEQVTEHAQATLGHWLDRASDATFVVTSRERLHVPGEDIFALEPLPLAKEAVDLFAARARAQRPDFVLSDANRTAVAEVVRLLDGLPLAIELAAARVRMFSPAQLVERMRDRFRLLAGASGAAARQATLKAAIDWSWDLLTPWEQAALGQCSVFEGGFMLEAAEAVLDLAPWPEAPPAMDTVQALVDKSLLRVWVPAEQSRFDLDEPYFGMYLSIHEYAAAKLAASTPAATSAAQHRHGKYFARFGSDETLEALSLHGGVKRRHALALELDNLVAACRRAVAAGHGETAVATYRAAWEVLEMQGPVTLAVTLGTQVLNVNGIAPSMRAAALATSAMASRRAGRMEEAGTWVEQALALFRAMGDLRQEGRVLGNMGNLLREQGRMEEARGHLRAALAIHRKFGNRRAEGTVLENLGNVHKEQGRMEEARAHYDAALTMHREAGNRRSEGSALGNLGLLHQELGRMEEACALYDQALAVHREVGNRLDEGMVLGNLANLFLEQGQPEKARAHYDAVLAVHREVGNRRGEGILLSNLGNLHREQGRLEEAHACCDAALVIHREVGNRRSEGIVLGNLGILHRDQGRIDEAHANYLQALAIHREVGNRRVEGVVLGRLGDLLLRLGRIEDACEALEAGEALLRELDDRLELAKLLCIRGRTDAANDDLDSARSALVEAEAIAETIGAGPDSDLHHEIVTSRAALA